MTATPATTRPHAFWRWLPPAALTAVFLFLLGHHSQDGQVFSRYSPSFFRLLAATGVWAAVCWWAALGRERFARVEALARALPLYSLAVLALGLLVLLDLL